MKFCSRVWLLLKRWHPTADDCHGPTKGVERLRPEAGRYVVSGKIRCWRSTPSGAHRGRSSGPQRTGRTDTTYSANANAKSRVLCPSVTECGAAAGRAISSFRRGPRSPTCSSRSLGNEALFLRLRFAQEMVPDRRRPPRVRRTTTKAPSRGRSVAFRPRMVKLAKRFRLRFQERPSD